MLQPGDALVGRREFRIRFLADLHVNSYWGILAPGFNAQGVPFALTQQSKWLWDNYEAMLDSLPKPNAYVVNGDLTHGKNFKSGGTGVYTQDQDIQNQMAVAVIGRAVEGIPWWMVQGTPYHEPSVAHVAYTLGAEKWNSGERYGQILDLAPEGFLGLNIAHHPDGGGAIYKGTTTDRMSLWSIISAYLGKIFDAPIIVRSHSHFYALWQANGRTVVQTPCWTFPDPYAKKQAYFRYTSDIGMVDIVLRKDEVYPTVEVTLVKQPAHVPNKVMLG